MDALASLEQAAAAAVGETAHDFRTQDGSVSDFFTTLGGEIHAPGGAGGYRDLGGSSLPAADGSTGGDYGVGDARRLVGQISSGGGGPVREMVDASSYLVAPSNPENPVQDLRRRDPRRHRLGG